MANGWLFGKTIGMVGWVSGVQIRSDFRKGTISVMYPLSKSFQFCKAKVVHYGLVHRLVKAQGNGRFGNAKLVLNGLTCLFVELCNKIAAMPYFKITMGLTFRPAE